MKKEVYVNEENNEEALPRNDGDIGEKDGNSNSKNSNYWKELMDNNNEDNTSQSPIPFPSRNTFSWTPNINFCSPFIQESTFTLGSSCQEQEEKREEVRKMEEEKRHQEDESRSDHLNVERANGVDPGNLLIL
ncbi:hypothetical protein O181_122745 [Austropuccinia psidii MF-1]|uniref:Uncharacterized protein n=1 Tax=Austropuccinia psidii MF-1 TaxID=1389203 RepID=A0A9Q3KPU6_9BASI|nr:hypothetical protein [Austropuccinia psidii MF-1]